MKISRNGYYNYLQKGENPEEDKEEKAAVKKIFWEHKRRYGSRRIVAELSNQGHRVSRKRVRKWMQEQGLQALQPKSFVPKTTVSPNGQQRSPNLLLTIKKPKSCNEVWVGDITYLPQSNGNWLYLAVWMDLYSRMIVGWELSDHMRNELIIKAFHRALKKRKPKKALIIHSDGGGQYGSRKFRNILQKRQFRQSMTRRENHYDNAFAESLFSRFKTELLQKGKFRNMEDATTECFDYIELYYNKLRLHSSLGYKSPMSFEKLQSEAKTD